MVLAHNLGLPRMGFKGDRRATLKAFCRGELNLQAQRDKEATYVEQSAKLQLEAGMDLISLGDFSWYDHVLDTSFLVGMLPDRYQNKVMDVQAYLDLARGDKARWFDTRYHYVVPSCSDSQNFALSEMGLLRHAKCLLSQGYRVKPIVLGPISLLWLSSQEGPSDFNKLDLLRSLLGAYESLMEALDQLGVEWVQIDEPVLALDLPQAWQSVFRRTYHRLGQFNTKVLLATYFGGMGEKLPLVCDLPIDALHVDVCRAKDELPAIFRHFSADKILSLGLVDGCNVWRNNLSHSHSLLEHAKSVWGEQLWVAPSCSLIHVPGDLDQEQSLEPAIKEQLSFAKQKLGELVLLKDSMQKGQEVLTEAFEENSALLKRRWRITPIGGITPKLDKRSSPYAVRAKVQRAALRLPLLPTTLLGSLPSGFLSVEAQESLGLDVVLAEDARIDNDVDAFARQLEGVVVTQHAWVQSEGPQCIKPLIIVGNVRRPRPVTVEAAREALSKTGRIVKSRLMGPVSMVAQAFLPDGLPWSISAQQIALALREEVQDLEAAGIRMIQIDEPSFSDLLPLTNDHWASYLNVAAQCFRLATAGVAQETQIHAHVCDDNLNALFQWISLLDADVVCLANQTLRGEWARQVGPGVLDCQASVVPSVDAIQLLLIQALHRVPVNQLWVVPTGRLNGESTEGAKAAITHMIVAASSLRAQFQTSEAPLLAKEYEGVSH